MTATVNVNESMLYKSLGDFINLTLGAGIPVIQGLGNRSAMPPDTELTGGFVAMTFRNTRQLSTNEYNLNDLFPLPSTLDSDVDTELRVQLDCYGSDANMWKDILAQVLRSPYGCDNLAPLLSPLYASDPIRMDLVNGEEQYEQRWMLEAVLQYNPVVSVPQDYFNEVDVSLVDVDATIDPEGLE
jgi:hypothetical protein